MKYLICLISLFISGCGGTMLIPGECEETSGLTICSEALIDLNEVDTLVGILERNTQEVYPEVKNIPAAFKRRDVVVSILRDWLALNCHEIKEDIYRCETNIGGAAINGIEVYVEYRECLPMTALGHELLHVIEFAYLGGSVGDHDAEKMFIQGAGLQGISVEETIEWKTFIDFYEALDYCGHRDEE